MKYPLIFILFMVILHIPCTILPTWYLIVAGTIDTLILVLALLMRYTKSLPYASDRQDSAETSNKLFNLLLIITILLTTSCAATDNSCEAYKKDVFKHKKNTKTPYNNWTTSTKPVLTPVSW
jgi:hypothetical protein